MEAYILKGNPKDVAKVIQENRIRVDRGVIEFTPCQPGTCVDDASVETLIESQAAAQKESPGMTVEQCELADLTGIIVSMVVEGGQIIPEDVTARLANFGIIVPKIGETANMEQYPDVMDDKHIEVEDMPDADIDADEKTHVGDDSKDARMDDAKETASIKKASRRSKNSE